MLSSEAIAAAAVVATGLVDYRNRVLGLLATALRFDVALIHALTPRVPLSTAALRGIDPSTLARQSLRWDRLADVLSPLRTLANRQLVATDVEAIPPRSKARRELEALVLRPFGQRAVCVVHLALQGRVVGAIVLMVRRVAGFDRPTLATLRRLAPSIAVGDALHQLQERRAGGPVAGLPLALRCDDQRLSPRQREIVEHVALGLTNVEIGAALGLSPFSVRNHLVRVFEAIGANNRADVVRRAVLVPKRG